MTTTIDTQTEISEWKQLIANRSSEVPPLGILRWISHRRDSTAGRAVATAVVEVVFTGGTPNPETAEAGWYAYNPGGDYSGCDYGPFVDSTMPKNCTQTLTEAVQDAENYLRSYPYLVEAVTDWVEQAGLPRPVNL